MIPIRMPYTVHPSAGAGRSEVLLAKALGARRKDAIVVTKGGLPTRQAQREERDRRDSRRASLLHDVEDSLRNLEQTTSTCISSIGRTWRRRSKTQWRP